MFSKINSKIIYAAASLIVAVSLSQAWCANILWEEDFDGATWASLASGDTEGNWGKGGGQPDPRIVDQYTTTPDLHMFIGPDGRVVPKFFPADTTTWAGDYTLEFDAYTHDISHQDANVGLYLGKLAFTVWTGDASMTVPEGNYAIPNMATWTVPTAGQWHHYKVWSGGPDLNLVKIWIDGELNFAGAAINGATLAPAPNTGMYNSTMGFFLDDSVLSRYISINNIVLYENEPVTEHLEPRYDPGVLLDEDFDLMFTADELTEVRPSGYWSFGGSAVAALTSDPGDTVHQNYLRLGTGNLRTIANFWPNNPWRGNYTIEFDARHSYDDPTSNDIGFYFGYVGFNLWAGNPRITEDGFGNYAFNQTGGAWTVPVKDVWHHYKIWSGGKERSLLKIWVNDVLMYEGESHHLGGSFYETIPNPGTLFTGQIRSIYIDNQDPGLGDGVQADLDNFYVYDTPYDDRYPTPAGPAGSCGVVSAFATHNSKLYAGVSSGRSVSHADISVWDGSGTWTYSGNTGALLKKNIDSMVSFNLYLWASSADSWADTETVVHRWNGNVGSEIKYISAAAGPATAFCVSDVSGFSELYVGAGYTSSNKLAICRVVGPTGSNPSLLPITVDASASPGDIITSLVESSLFGVKTLYAGSSSGRLYASTDGSSWSVVMGVHPSGTSGVSDTETFAAGGWENLTESGGYLYTQAALSGSGPVHVYQTDGQIDSWTDLGAIASPAATNPLSGFDVNTRNAQTTYDGKYAYSGKCLGAATDGAFYGIMEGPVPGWPSNYHNVFPSPLAGPAPGPGFDIYGPNPGAMAEFNGELFFSDGESFRVYRFETPTMAANVTTINSNRIMEINGEPFFPINMYLNSPSDQDDTLALDCAELAAAGFNTIYLPGFTQNRFDIADTYGLKIMSFTPGLDFGTIKTQVSDARKNHPAMFTWKHADEPNPFGATIDNPDRIEQYHYWTDLLDPDHTSDVHGNQYWRYYIGAVDHMEIYRYVPRGGNVSDIHAAELEANGPTVANGEKPIWHLLFAMTSSGNDAVAPTPDENRVKTYLAIIHGAKGIGWWSLRAVNDPSIHLNNLGSNSALLWTSIKQVVGELNELMPVLISPENSALVSVNSAPASYVTATVFKVDYDYYVMAANEENAAASADFTMAVSVGDSADVLWESRSVSVTNDTFSDAFGAYGVHIYHIGALDSDGDGLPDEWEIDNFGDTTSYNAADDPDTDGSNNGSEYDADTDPNDSGSVFKITDITVTGGGSSISITWSTVTTRKYAVYYSDDLSSGYLPVPGQQNRPGQVGSDTWVDDGTELSPPSGGAKRFYKVEVKR